MNDADRGTKGPGRESGAGPERPQPSFLQRQRWRMDAWLTARGRAHTFSLPLFQLHHQLWSLLDQHVTGPCLDAGSGRSPLKQRLLDRGVQVLSIDVEDRTGEVDLVADVQNMPEVADASQQAVVCTQVLEHVPRPWDAVRELARVLRPGGVLILSVPHLSAIHEAPHDYFRYTRYGLTALLEEAGLRPVEVREAGGLVSFLAHGCSLVTLGSLAALPGLRRAAWLGTYLVLVRLLDPVDRLIGLRSRYPCNYVVLAVKEAAPGASE